MLFSLYTVVPLRPYHICVSLETRSILDKDALNENPKASSLANLRSEAVADCQEEDKTAASGRIMTSATSVSYPAGEFV